jgi:hypothetical protein
MEPHPVEARLTTMPQGSEHAQHDALLVAAFAAGDLRGQERDDAMALIADCPDCRTLHDDLVSIARATADLPAAVRPRDFQISPEQAARLRPSPWRRLVAAFAAPGPVVSRQLGVALTTFGAIGLLLSSLSALPLGMASSGAAPAASQPAMLESTSDTAGGGGSAAPAAPEILGAGSPTAQPFTGNGGFAASPAASADDRARVGASASPDTAVAQRPAGAAGGPTNAPVDEGTPGGRDVAAPDSGPSPLFAGSVVLLSAGLILLVARRIARRFTAT